MSKAQKPDKKEEAATKVKDESRDHIYYTITPRLVWALSQDPFDLALWVVIKDIAGENGTCILARDDLALLAMMSSGQVSISRERLLAKKLLKGKLKRDPGYPQEVWHLSIPDFWEANVRWARMYPTIRSRVEFKREQKRLADLEKKRAKEEKEASQGDGTPSQLKVTSQGDGGLTPCDERLSPHDVKNNVFKKPKEEVKEEELLNLFSEVALIVFQSSGPRVSEEVLRELESAKIEISGDYAFSVSGLARADYYESRYRRSFERAFVGLIGEEVSVDFQVGVPVS